LFFHKNKKYIPKIIDRHLSKQYERVVGLLSIIYIFLEEKPKKNIMEIFKMTFIRTKDKQYKEKISDKYHKMKQNDSVAFIKLFNISSVALIGQKANVFLSLTLDRRKTEINSVQV
jgi:hypothetical protein